MSPTVPPAEVSIDAGLARALLSAQHPDFSGHEVVPLDEGWDNFTFRVGERHALRLPRRELAVELLLKEQRWLGKATAELGMAVPRVVAVGVPSELFRWPWSVVEWIPGATADVVPLRDDQAPVLASALRRLHARAPADAPSNPVRGVPLVQRAELVAARLDDAGLTDLLPRFRNALDAPLATERSWLHGDLHPRNVVVAADGTVAGLIDWGDMAAGDAATDLACAWMLFDSQAARGSFLDAYGATPAERRRAAGWAVSFASFLATNGEPRLDRLGAALVARLREQS